MHESHWQSIHLHYHDADKDALILHGVRPLFRRLAGQVDAAYFTRHWRQGPHLRLNVRTDVGTFHSLVWPTARQLLGAALTRFPSKRSVDPGTRIAADRRLAELEQDPGPLLPWYPDNSLRIAAYDAREVAFGGPELAELVADCYADTTELTFRMIDEVSGAARLALGFNLMIATAHALSGVGVGRAFVSFRSHAEAFLHGFPEAAGLRPKWDEHYRRHADGLARRLDAVLTTLDGGPDTVPFVRDWVAELGPYRDRARTLLRATTAALPSVGRELTASELAELSPFHRALYANPRWRDTEESVEFQLYRLLLNLTYLALTRIGGAPIERFLLCHLAANTVEKAYGRSGIDLVGATETGAGKGLARRD